MQQLSTWIERLSITIVRLIYANLLYLVFCLGVITIPSSGTALFKAVRLILVENRTPKFRQYYRDMSSNFKFSTVIGVVSIVSIAPVILDLRLLWGLHSSYRVGISVVVWFYLFVWLTSMTYIYPLLIEKPKSARHLILFSLRFGIYKFHFTCLNLIILFSWSLIAFYVPLLYLFFFFSVAATVTTWFAQRKMLEWELRFS